MQTKHLDPFVVDEESKTGNLDIAFTEPCQTAKFPLLDIITSNKIPFCGKTCDIPTKISEFPLNKLNLYSIVRDVKNSRDVLR